MATTATNRGELLLSCGNSSEAALRVILLRAGTTQFQSGLVRHKAL
jgi:hypothetical protein